ncbi:MAG: ABC transporter permease [Nitrospinota bacterium]|nr:MAG: ABC transporter permease [Nitrospinota bacterium]
MFFQKPWWDVLRDWRAYQRLLTLFTTSDRARFWALGSLPLLWLLGAHLLPLLQMAVISFYTQFPVIDESRTTFTLQNYLTFFRRSVYLTAFGRTLLFATLVSFSTLIMVYPIAYFIAQVAEQQKQLRYLLLLLAPYWASYIIRTFAWMIVLGNKGLLNAILRWLGVIDEPVPFMYTSFSLSMGVLYVTILYMLLPLYSSIEKIDSSLLQAAADLGATPFQRFLRVTLPLSKEGIFTGCLLVFILTSGLYAVPVLLGGPHTTLFAESIGNYFSATSQGEWPMGCALAFILLLVMLGIAGVSLRVIRISGEKLL